jgi:hypothetical protein
VTLRVAILTSHHASFPRILAEGLQRMFSSIEVESHLFYNGLSRLSTPKKPRFTLNPRSIMRHLFHLVATRESAALFDALASYDIIVVVQGIPDAFVRTRLDKIEAVIRTRYPDKIVVNYSNYYLLTRGPWLEWLKQGNPAKGVPTGGNFGLERYDWYFCTSVVSEYPLPSGTNPYSLIGVNLDDGSLYPEQKDRFLALVDFERKDHLQERSTQIQALQETNTEYIVLQGRYSIEEIRKIYRTCSIYLLASPESFGIPICEVQACGSYVFAAHAHWCASHWLKDDVHAAGAGRLSPNFMVYHNDLETLKQKITEVRRHYDAQQVFNTFLHYHPQLFYGDTEVLQDFVAKVRRGEITGHSHQEYGQEYGQGVAL